MRRRRQSLLYTIALLFGIGCFGEGVALATMASIHKIIGARGIFRRILYASVVFVYTLYSMSAVTQF